MVLTYFYEKYNADYTAQNELIINEISAIDITHSALEQKDEQPAWYLAKQLQALFPEEEYDNDMTYLVQHCFEKLAERGIDTAYLQAMVPAYDMYIGRIPELVNTYTSTFQYDDMDLIDRVIFLLGYAEFKLLKTPKEVILNEMIELAKKYGDTGSSKLINGIMHKMLSAESTGNTENPM